MKKKKYIGLVRRSLAEDIGKNGDVTSKAIFSKKEKATFVLIAKDSGILCGMEPFSAVFAELNRSIGVDVYFRDGDILNKGDIVARVYGKQLSLHAGSKEFTWAELQEVYEIILGKKTSFPELSKKAFVDV